MLEFLNRIDTALLLEANSHHTSFWDSVMWYASGTYTWIPLYAILLIVLAFRFKKHAITLLILIPILILLSDQLASGLIKPLAHRLRPSHEPALLHQLHFVNRYQGGLYGFVSSHAANVFALAFYLFFTVRKQLPWLAYVLIPWAVFVSYSRIYLGVHYPGDVLAAGLLGVLVAFLIARIYGWISKNKCAPVA